MASSQAGNIHTSVLLDETIELIAPQPGQIIVDATLGLGGHARAILERHPGITLIGLDQDAEAIGFAKANLKEYEDRVSVVHTNFANIAAAVAGAGIASVDGVIADLGVSSLQFDSESRGFSFRFDAPLDMRMDADNDSPTAAELLLTLSEEEIANVIYQYG